MLTFASVCSGIEAPSVATGPLGWRPLWFAEIAPFPAAVLAHRYPDITNHGDFTTLITNPPASPDVLIGGTPCQSFSVAGLRGGLTDHRGNLALAFMALVDVLRPRWLLWENVPGVLSSNGGRDFGSILGALGKLGYGFSYRVCDAQFFGLAQRRKRVFLVGYSGDWRRSAAALFEPESLRRDSPPRRGSGAGVTGTVGTGASGGGGWRIGADEAAANQIVPAIRAFGGGNCSGAIDVATACLAHPNRSDFDVETFVASIQDARPRSKGQNGAGVSTDGVSYTLDAANTQAVAFAAPVAPCLRSNTYNNSDARMESQMLIAHTLRGTGHDASEDGTGRGVPLVVEPLTFDWQAGGGGADKSFRGGSRSWVCDKPGRTRALTANKRLAVAYSVQEDNQNGVTMRDIAGSVRADAPGSQTGGSLVFVPPIPFDTTQITSAANYSNPQPGDPCHPLSAHAHAHAPKIAHPSMGVRRLSCTEMERLQGFPDGYTAIPYRGKPAEQCPDGPRAKALGNSMATPVIRWICQRIETVDALTVEVP